VEILEELAALLPLCDLTSLRGTSRAMRDVATRVARRWRCVPAQEEPCESEIKAARQGRDLVLLAWVSGRSAAHHLAASGASKEALRASGAGDLEDPDGAGRTPLAYASAAGHASTVQALVDLGVDVNGEPAADGATPLSWATYEGHADVVARLLAAGADANAGAAGGEMKCPLGVAALRGRLDIVEMLLRAGAEVDTPGLAISARKPLLTALQIAARFGCADVVGALVAAGADCTRRDADGNTPLCVAVANDDVDTVKELLRAGDAGVDVPGRDGVPPLHLAVRSENSAAVHALLAAGAAVNLTEPERSSTPLHIGAAVGHVDIVRALLASGADVGARDGVLGATPLHWIGAFTDARDDGLWERQLCVVDALVAAGADPTARCLSGRTPAQYAQRAHCLAMAERLTQLAREHAGGR